MLYRVGNKKQKTFLSKDKTRKKMTLKTKINIEEASPSNYEI